MKRFVLLMLFFISIVFSREITPQKEIKMQGNVMDIAIVDDLLYASTDGGTLEVYDIKNDKFVNTIKLKKIHDFMGDLMPPKVYSADFINGKIILLAEGENGSRELYINENGVTTKVITPKDKLTMNKAKFVDDSHVFIGLLSNEIILYDFNKKKQLYKKQLSQSKFSDFALNEKKDKAVISCESGINYLVDVKTGDVIRELKGGNKDNVFKVSFKNSKVSAGGQDRVGAVYDSSTGSYETYNAPFLIYATGLSKDATMVAFAFGVDNEIVIFDTSTNSKKYTLKGQKSTLNSIVFYDKETIFSGSDDKFIMKWSLK